VVEKQSDSLIFYKNDGITPLDDPSLDSEETEPFRDIVSNNTSDSSQLLATPSSDVKLEDPFEDGIIEVYGPPFKRPRLSAEVSPDGVLDPLPVGFQHHQAVSEELPVSKTPTLTDSTYIHESQSSNQTVVEAVDGHVDGGLIPVAAATTAGIPDDNQVVGHPSDPQDGSGLKPVTQDEQGFDAPYPQ
jgi:hypothetical protein